MVEVYKRGGSIEACMEIIEYATLSVELTRFRKNCILNSNYRQHTVPINLDADNSERANVIDNVWTEG